METILIVDDEKNYLVVLEALLGPEGYETVTADNGEDALSLIRGSDLDLVITDMKMPEINGMDLLDETKKIKPELPVILMTAYGTIEMAVEAMKRHAYDYITKPFKNEELKLTIKKALENYRLVKENRLLSEALSDRYRYGNIIGKSNNVLIIRLCILHRDLNQSLWRLFFNMNSFDDRLLILIQMIHVRTNPALKTKTVF